MQRKIVSLLLFLALLAGVTACGTAPDTSATPGSYYNGGVEITLQAACNLNGNHCASAVLAQLPQARAILEQRVKHGLGAAQVVARLEGTDRIVVDLAGQYNNPDAIALLTRIGKLEFIDTGPIQLADGTAVQPGQYPVRFTGDQLDPNSINATIDQQSGQPVILFAFKSAEQSAFAQYTRANIGDYLTITLDGKVIESAVIQSEITGLAQISGGHMTLSSAQQTAALMRYGALPLPLTIISQYTIST
ncbi:MAG TPA: hypothetical protein VH599_09500 [Ktedonobacterales bacterium]|jgi:preprotein translocase subunit SecD